MAEVALITGGTRGIGLEIARSLAKEGFQLALNGVRKKQEIEPILREFENMGIKAIYIQGDISERTARNIILKEVEKTFSQLNVLVNNAGIAPETRKDILECTEESFSKVLNVNLKGSFFLSQEVSKWMLRQKMYDESYKGCIINISSISADTSSVNRPEYCISKAGLSMTTQLFAMRLGDYNLPVYEIRPGIIETDMTAGVLKKYQDLIENQNLCIQKRLGKGEDVGKAAAALARGDFPYSSGQVFTVDGGLTINRL